MKITTNEGEFELINLAERGTAQPYYALKPIEPIKKTEERSYHIALRENGNMVVEGLIQVGELTPDTLSKLSEAISALVEYVTGKSTDETDISNDYNSLLADIDNAAESFQESQ